MILSKTSMVGLMHAQNWSIGKSLLVVGPIATLMAGVELALILGLRQARDRNVDWPLTLMAVLAALFLALGVGRHYIDIWIHRTVRGISFIFVAIDAAGDLCSLVSLFFQPNLDVLGLVIYGTEFALWLGVFACGVWFNLLPWAHHRLESKRESKSAREPQHGPFRQSEGPTEVIALHDLPSSTSVFRTTSSELARARNVSSRNGTETRTSRL